MSAPNDVIDLIHRFKNQYDSYHSPSYNETQVRREFVDPLFKALGWDVDNSQGHAEAYKDVIHEDSIKVGGSTKAPDYSFRIGGVRKFFVETKKPSVNIAQDVSPAFQLRRYAWSAKLPLSILTDFEELAVYDCRVRPEKNDKASTARTLYFTYDQYEERWDEIASIFSREAILKGSFDKYAESTKRKRGTATVDDAFLKEIEQWRSDLARNLALRNADLSQREINVGVQKTIDRMIFLRICEDRGIEDYGQLQSLQSGPKVYARMCELFRRADERYNSGLFHFSKEKDRTEPADEWTLSLAIDDKILKNIIGNLYYPESPYEFSVVGSDILGQVYEQFLGKVIRLTKGHQAKIEDKPEVKKAGGVYYTPTYIVDYIVEQTIGKLLEEKEPHEVAARTKTTWKPSKRGRPLSVLDPACGSGSFLIGAYQYLLDWYRDWYVEHVPAKHKDRIYQTRKDEWRLTTAERKRILLDHIYGVDIDPQAVEVTKLSLLLKVLEGENQESLQRQLRLFRERALPDLADNIKCGNSLIGPDFYQGKQLDMFDEEERLRINVFDWQTEFSEIMKSGGFDAVIGNPPYGAAYDQLQKRYFQLLYVYKNGKPETYIFFLDKGVRLLTKNGMLGFITPNAWLTNHYGVQIRRWLLEHCSLEQVVDLEPTKVFEKAVVDTAITVLVKGTDVAGRQMSNVWQGTKDRGIVRKFQIDQSVWRAGAAAVINLQADPHETAILTRLERSQDTIERLVEFSQGAIPYESKADGQANRYISRERHSEDWLPLLESAAQVRRYEVDVPTAFIHYGPWLCRPRDGRFFSEPKILFHRLRKKLPVQLVGGLDETGAINRHALSNFVARPSQGPDTLRAVLGLFNSRFANWWFVKRFGVLMEVGRFKINKLPLPEDWGNKSDAIVNLVNRMLALHKQSASTKTAHERTALQRQIEATDAEIDRLVYELHGLSDEEIRIVEEATAQ